MSASTMIQKVWNFCHTPRDDGLVYGDYREQFTHLLFLQMADGDAQNPTTATHTLVGYDWPSLKCPLGASLEDRACTR